MMIVVVMVIVVVGRYMLAPGPFMVNGMVMQGIHCITLLFCGCA